MFISLTNPFSRNNYSEVNTVTLPITASIESPKPLQHGYHTVGEHRGNPRIWLQGGKLTDAQFEKGAFYDVSLNIDTQTISLVFTDTPTKMSRKVSGRFNRATGLYTPIIDLAFADLIDVVDVEQRIRADFYHGAIHISIHHHDVKQAEREARLMANLKKGVVTKGVLCSGIGMSAAAGHDGLAAMGITSRTEFIIDRERRYLDVALQNNHAITDDTVIFEAKLEEIEPELLGYVDMLSVSLPCTGHGASGKTKNKIKFAEEHPTDALAVIGLIRMIDACQPAIVVSENVVEAMKSATYILIKSMLEALGYNVTEKILNSQNTKSFENRERYWFVATSKGLPTANLDDFPAFNAKYETLQDLLEHVPLDSPMWKSTEAKVKKAALNKANGKNFGFNLLNGTETNIRVAGKGYQKDRASEPHIAGPNETMRLLTVNELADAQSAPHHLIQNASDAVIYEGLGQGIDFLQGYGVMLVVGRDVLQPLTLQKCA
jgi:DNA (cytosine-5)-methyltransferase 1